MMYQSGRLSPEQRVELEKRLAKVRTDHIVDVRKMVNPVVRYNSVGANTAATTYKGGCAGCGKLPGK